MKRIKKVAVSPIPRNEASVIDSFNTTDDKTINAPSINAVENYTYNKNDIYTKTETDNKYKLQSDFRIYNGETSISSLVNYEDIVLTGVSTSWWVLVGGTIDNYVVGDHPNLGVTLIYVSGTGTVLRFYKKNGYSGEITFSARIVLLRSDRELDY